jgi:methylated-DNA-[protein]-cysteine S-methyltransferase
MNRKIIKPTPFGSVGLIWTGGNDSPRIVRILLSRPGLCAEEQVAGLYSHSPASSCPAIERIVIAIRGFLEGEEIEFSLDSAELGLCSGFQQLVLRAEHGIARGSVSTYQLIADHMGKRNGARAVGNALANNPFPLIVPCHRAVRSDRRLGGYQGGLEMKRALLEKEGIPFDEAGRVVCAQFYYGRIVSDKGSRPAR